MLACVTGAQKGQAPGLSAMATTAAHPTPGVPALGKHQAPGQVANAAGILLPALVPASVPTCCPGHRGSAPPADHHTATEQEEGKAHMWALR